MTLSNGDVFAFDESVASWIRIRDDSFSQSELYSVLDRPGSPSPPIVAGAVCR